MIKRIYFSILVMCVLLVGCSTEDEGKKGIKSIDDVKTDSLVERSGTYVGDNSQVITIVKELAGGETIQTIDLTDKVIKLTYGANGEVMTKELFNQFWFDDRNSLEKNLLHNAIYLTILVPNAEGFSFNIASEATFTVRRNEMVSELKDVLGEFPLAVDLMDQKTVDSLLDNHKQKINEILNSNEYRQSFYEKFPIE